MSEDAALAVLMLGIPAAGWAALDLLRCRVPNVALGWALSVAVGFAAITLSLYLPFAATGRVHFWPALVLLAAGAARSAWQALRGGRRSLALLRSPFWVGIAIVGVLLLYFARTAPFWGYDAKAIYGIKGKALLHERDLRGPIFQDADSVHYHADYPLGLPLVMAFSAWAAVGPPEDPTGAKPARSIAAWLDRHDSVRVYSSVACLWLLGMLGFAVHFAREQTPGRASIVLLALLAMPVAIVLPWVGGRSFSLEGADVPLALTVGACAWLMFEHLRTGSRGPLAASAGLAAAAMFLKNEAVVALGALLAAVALCHGPRTTARPALWVGGGALLAGVLAAGLAATTAGAPYDERYLDSLLEMDVERLGARLPLLSQAIWSVLETRGMLPHWLFVLCVAAPWGLIRGGAPRVWALWVLGHVAATTAIFLVTPNDIGWHVAAALPRLWSQVAVAAAAIVVFTAGDAWSRLYRDQRVSAPG